MSILVLVLANDVLTREAILYDLYTSGYLMVGFEDGSRALRALTGVKFDVLIMSTSHPFPSRGELLRQAKRLQPNLRIILIDGAPPEGAAVPYVDAFLQRPFRMKSVHDALKRVLCHQHQSELRMAWLTPLLSSSIH